MTNTRGRKRKPNGTSWKPGQSGNPHGRPKTGQTWSEICREVGDLYPEEIAQILGRNNPLSQQIGQLPKGVQVKFLVVARVMVQLMLEPSAGLLAEVFDRIEGRVTDKLQGTQQLNILGLEEMLDKVYGEGSNDPGEDE